MAEERKSWVDGIVQFSAGSRLNTVKLTRKVEADDDPNFPWSASLLDDGFDKVMKSLEAKGFTFTSEMKSTLFEALSFMAWQNDIDTFCACLSMLFEDDDFDLAAISESNLAISYLPIQRDIKNQFTGITNSDDLHVLVMYRDTPVVKCENGTHKIDAHSLQGFYMEAANLIVVDLTLCEDSKSLVHELTHCIIASLRTYLDDAMYDVGENKREEICVHFMTDGFERLTNLHKVFGKLGDGDKIAASDVSSLKWNGVKSKLDVQMIKQSSRLAAATASAQLTRGTTLDFANLGRDLSKRFAFASSFKSYASTKSKCSLSTYSKSITKWRIK